MRMEFCTIASGSSGNCTYIGTDYTKILIDAGISGKKIEEGLANLKLTGDKIDALFITHEHVDHIKGAGILSRRFDIPIFATADTWAAPRTTTPSFSRSRLPSCTRNPTEGDADVFPCL